MNRYKTFDSSGVAPNGKLFAGDLNAIQDAAAALTDYNQHLAIADAAIGEAGLLLSRFGAGEAQLSGKMRVAGYIRAAGVMPGEFTSAQRDAIAAGSRPSWMIIYNTTNGRYEYNAGSDASPNWQPLSATLGANSITANEIAADAVGSSELADNAVDTNAIQNSAVTNAKIAAGTINGDRIANDTITATQLAADSVGNSELAPNAVTAAEIAADAVTADEIQAGAVGDSELVAGLKASDYGTAFPSSGLFNGYRFALFVNNLVTGVVAWKFIYRPDLDSTYPWHFMGGHPVYFHDNSAVQYTNAWQDVVNYTIPRAGWWLIEAQAQSHTDQANQDHQAAMGFRVGAAAPAYYVRNRPSGEFDESPIALSDEMLLAAGADFHVAMRNNYNANQQSARYRQCKFTPLKLA